jgi:[protein-PII] uridylyltransferase
MSSISQKTDVHDPETIINFTKNVNSIEKLNYIYMLTINDIRGTNPTLWNSWKHDLLKQLFMSSRRKLNLEETQSSKSIVQERKAASINAAKHGHDFLNEVWDQLPDAYFAKHQLEQLSNQAKTVAGSNKKTSVFVRSRKNLIEIFIFTPNQAGLFLKTVKSFEQLSLETIDSDIHTTNDGEFAINTFICRHKILGGNLIQKDIQNIEQKIIAAISSENSRTLTKSKTSYTKVFEYPTRVHISHTNKKDVSLVTLETLDQPNLLSKVANIFLDHGISIDSARITTLGEKVEDNFTVVDEKTKSCITQNKANKLQKKLKNL